jgi:tyrosine-protein kinase Etk/Wzc
MPDNDLGNSPDEINLLQYLVVVLKRKRLVVAVTVAVAVLSAAVSLLLPEIYRAETRILPPQKNSSGVAAELLGTMQGLSLIPGADLALKSSTDLYTAMIKSRKIYDSIIDRFDLMKVYDVQYREDARAELDDAMKAETYEDNIISVTVEDEDPERAAAMANAFVEELKKLVKSLAISEASQRRLFFEQQLGDTKEALTRAEENMAKFLKGTGSLKIDNQADAAIQAIANLNAQIAEREVKLKVMKTYSTPNNPDYQKVQEELSGLRAELDKLDKGSHGKGFEPLLPTAMMPEAGTEYLRKLREVKYQEALYELFLKQYETARLDEAGDSVVLQVIDEAVTPEKRARPKRGFIVAVSTFMGFFLALLAAFALEYRERALGDPGSRELMERLRRYASIRKR